MKTILFIFPWLPYPLSSGGKAALYSSITSVKNDYKASLAYRISSGPSGMDAEKEFNLLHPEIELLPLRDSKVPSWKKFGKKIYRKITNVFMPNKASRNWINSLSPLPESWYNHINEICSERKFDVIQVEMPWMISAALILPKDSFKIYIHHELGFVRREQELSQMYPRPYTLASKKFADICEYNLLNLYDLIITLSPIDAEKLNSLNLNVPVRASFATVEVQGQYEYKESDGLRLSFVGSGAHYPNVDGLRWFLANCWDRLQRVNRNYHLDVIGVWDDKVRKDLMKNYSGVSFLGFVDNLHDALEGSIMLVPINIGSGIRMKILEACAMEIPFVSTTVGAEGIPVENGKNCYIADSPQDFVDSLMQMQDKGIQRKLSADAKQMVDCNFSKEALRNNRISIYKEFIHD